MPPLGVDAMIRQSFLYSQSSLLHGSDSRGRLHVAELNFKAVT